MKLSITKIEEVSIDKRQQREITIKYLEDRYQLHRDMRIEDGNLMEEVEYVTSHKWYSNEVVRIATRSDKEVLLIIKELYAESR